MTRKYLPSLGDLIDRLSINQIKELMIPEHKDQYATEIKDILHDINLIIQQQKISVDADIIRAMIVVAQMNLHVWHNEKNARNGVDGPNDLRLSHGLNGLRVQAKNIVNNHFKQGMIDYKVDCLAADFKDWQVSWSKPEEKATWVRPEELIQEKGNKMNVYAFNVDHTLEVSDGPIPLQALMDLRIQGHIVGICGNWALFLDRVTGWQHLASFLNVGIDKVTFLMNIKHFAKADDYIMVGNIAGVSGASDDQGAAAGAGWRFIKESDFAGGAR